MQLTVLNQKAHFKEKTKDRISSIVHIEETVRKQDSAKEKMPIVNTNFSEKKKSYVLYNISENTIRRKMTKKEYNLYNYCVLSVCVSFILGIIFGVILMSSSQKLVSKTVMSQRIAAETRTRTLNSLRNEPHSRTSNKEQDTVQEKYPTVSFTGLEIHKYNKNVYPKGLTEDMKDILKDNKIAQHRHRITNVIESNRHVPNNQTILYDNIFWGAEIEDAMPQGYGENSIEVWEKFVEDNEVVKMEPGCGRMQNRLVTFRDGIQACVRYRQNTDQIQGEIFSFYVATILNLKNLAPSVVKVVDVKDKLWKNVATEISNAQWGTNRAVVLTQYIPSLESASIPEIFKPSSRHLNKYDVLKISMKENDTISNKILIDKIKNKYIKKSISEEKFDHIDVSLNKKTINQFVELAQWSDLIIFDYLTANLDRIVNNLFNYQWNVNIMDGPAHNLARKMDSGLLLFLDNESGLLHGYRLLKKYNVYHSLMLDNLCVFRKNTVLALRKTFDSKSIGTILSDMFHNKNNAIIRDILPPLPNKNVKILQERIGKVLNQVEKCQLNFANG